MGVSQEQEGSRGKRGRDAAQRMTQAEKSSLGLAVAEVHLLEASLHQKHAQVTETTLGVLNKKKQGLGTRAVGWAVLALASLPKAALRTLACEASLIASSVGWHLVSWPWMVCPCSWC